MCEIVETIRLFVHEVYCEDHGTPAEYVLKVGSSMIPMCEECLKELKDALEEV